MEKVLGFKNFAQNHRKYYIFLIIQGQSKDVMDAMMSDTGIDIQECTKMFHNEAEEA